MQNERPPPREPLVLRKRWVGCSATLLALSALSITALFVPFQEAWAEETTNEAQPTQPAVLDETSPCGDLTLARERFLALTMSAPPRNEDLIPFLHMSTDPVGVRGEVHLKQGQQSVFEKVIVAANCEDVLEALVLSTEIYLDEEAPIQPAEESAPPKPTGTSPQMEPDIDPFSLPGDKAPKPAAPLPREDLMLLVGPTHSWGALPQPSKGSGTWGGAILARIRTGEAWSVTGEVRYAMAREFNRERFSYRFSSTSLLFGPGYSYPLSRVLTLRADGEFVANLVHVTFEGPGGQTGASRAPSLGAAMHAGIGIFPWSSLMFELRVGMTGLFSRGRYVDNERELLWQEPVASATAGLFIGWAKRSAIQQKPRDSDKIVSLHEGSVPSAQWY